MRGHRLLLSGFLFTALFFSLLGCDGKPQPKQDEGSIVAFAEQHGSGDLRFATVSSIRVWARNQGDVSREILAKCRALQGVDATWQETTEGRLCLAVKQQSFWGFSE